jgi:ATP-dependent DNA helicase RecG
MTEYEVYSYEAFRKKYQDDIREVPRASLKVLDQGLLEAYINRLKMEKPNLSVLADETIYELMSITKDGMVTLSSLLLFCKYPQAYFPQLCITAVVLPGDEIGEVGEYGERFVDNKRIEGNIPEMLDQALAFVRKNMRTKTIINPNSGKREDRTDYPIMAVREALLNSLVHRDYSIHTEGMPIQILMYPDRIEIRNPGGIYGRLRVDQLGKMQPDTRNPVLVTALEVMGLTENRYSGIPTIRRSMKDFNLEDPVFSDERGTFTVILYKRERAQDNTSQREMTDKEEELLNFLKLPRSRNEIAEYLGLGTIAYVMQTYINPLVERGLVRLTIPEKPKSPKQRFVRK